MYAIIFICLYIVIASSHFKHTNSYCSYTVKPLHSVTGQIQGFNDQTDAAAAQMRRQEADGYAGDC